MTIDITGIASKYIDEYRPLLVKYRFPILGLLALPLIQQAYGDYCDWYDLGAGGLPHNPIGWAYQCILRVVSSSDTKSTGCYDKVEGTALDGQSYLDGDLPARKGQAPIVAPFVAPHRQVTDKASVELIKNLSHEISQIPTENLTVLEILPSVMEGGSPALFVSESAFATSHSHAKRSPREAFHVHKSDGSCHGIFSKRDSKILIEKGWGERHGLGGRAMGIPDTYLMVYAPRNDDEVKVVVKLAKAAARYCLEGKAVS